MKLDKPLNLNFGDHSMDGCQSSSSLDEHEARRASKQRISDERSIEGRYEKESPELQTLKGRLGNEIERNEALTAELNALKQRQVEYEVVVDNGVSQFIRDIAPFFYKRKITYVDVGAFIGKVFLEFSCSKHLDVREAHLFEPNPKSFSILENEVAKVKKVQSVHAYNLGLSDVASEKTFSAAKSMTKIVERDANFEGATQTFRCKVETLDTRIGSITDRHINILKIDVEGFEIPVLKGAAKTLSEQGIDVIYIEVGFDAKGTQQTYFAAIDEMLQALGYRVFKIYEQRNEWISDSPWLRRCNFAYMSKSFSDRNPFELTLELFDLRKQLANK